MSEEKLVKINAASATLDAILTLPENAEALVIFAHGSGSSRLSPRNKLLAGLLQKAGFGTLLFDLLTEEEDEVYANRFKIPLLAQRLKAATLWARSLRETAMLQVGYFGASTGTAVALVAAADFPTDVKAVVSRAGRPDLAEAALEKVLAPTLLIVGGEDRLVIRLNKTAYERIKAEKDLKIIPGATHLFEERGALEKVAGLAAEWFRKHFIKEIERKHLIEV